MYLDEKLITLFKGLASSLSPYFKESDKIVEGCKLVCVESPEVFANNLVLLGLNKKIPEVIQALHFVSQKDYSRNYDEQIESTIDPVITKFRDWIPQGEMLIDRGCPSISWNLVRTSQAIARSLCISVASSCLDEIVPLEQRIELYNELSNPNEDSLVWRFCGSEEIMKKASNYLADHTTLGVNIWHQDLKQRFESC